MFVPKRRGLGETAFWADQAEGMGVEQVKILLSEKGILTGSRNEATRQPHIPLAALLKAFQRAAEVVCKRNRVVLEP